MDPIFKASDIKPRPALWDDSDEEEDDSTKVLCTYSKPRVDEIEKVGMFADSDDDENESWVPSK